MVYCAIYIYQDYRNHVQKQRQNLVFVFLSARATIVLTWNE